jgi:hypothetical protein
MALMKMVSAFAVYLLPGILFAEVFISEIMYNDYSLDDGYEWVEVYNSSAEHVDLSGWKLADIEDNEISGSIPPGTVIQAHSALVFVESSANFQKAWGRRSDIIELARFPELFNNPSEKNEIIALINSNSEIVDSVNFDDENGWPEDAGKDGFSIYLKPGKLNKNDNDKGANWLPSSVGVHGASFSFRKGGGSHASPGFVEVIANEKFAPRPDNKWSIVVLPDIQNYSRYENSAEYLKAMTSWIDREKKKFNIRLVMFEGDLVHNNAKKTSDADGLDGVSQWRNVKSAVSVLNGNVPYLLSVGNHDLGVMNAESRKTELNYYFSSDELVRDYQQLLAAKTGFFEKGKLENIYLDFKAPDGREVLIFSLEWGPRREVIEWAKNVASQEKYSDHTMMLLTHAFTFSDGNRLNRMVKEHFKASPYAYPGTAVNTSDGEDLWQLLARDIGNFEFVFSGHITGGDSAYRMDKGARKQVVHQLLFNTQAEAMGGNGFLRVIEFLNNGTSVVIRTYSPVLAVEKKNKNNFIRLGISHFGDIEAFDSELDIFFLYISKLMLSDLNLDFFEQI